MDHHREYTIQVSDKKKMDIHCSMFFKPAHSCSRETRTGIIELIYIRNFNDKNKSLVN